MHQFDLQRYSQSNQMSSIFKDFEEQTDKDS